MALRSAWIVLSKPSARFWKLHKRLSGWTELSQAPSRKPRAARKTLQPASRFSRSRTYLFAKLHAIARLASTEKIELLFHSRLLREMRAFAQRCSAVHSWQRSVSLAGGLLDRISIQLDQTC